MRSSLQDNRAHKLFFAGAPKGVVQAITTTGTGTLTIVDGAPMILKVTPGAAHAVQFPTIGSRFIYIVIHGSTTSSDLTLVNSSGTTIATLSQSEMALVVDDGVATWAGVLKQT